MRIVYHHRTRATDAQRIHIQEIIKAFETLGHEVVIVSLVHPETAQEDAKRDAEDPSWKKLARKVPWSSELMQLGYNLVGIPMLAAKLSSRRVDFIYERYSLFTFAGVFVARLFRVPIVLEVNSPGALELKRDGEISSFGFAQWVDRMVWNAATRVIVVSSPLRQILAESGVTAEKLVLMPNGVNRDLFRREPRVSEKLRQSLGLDGKIVIGFVGWFRKWHGLDLLLQAFHLAGLGPGGARLMLIGDGPVMQELQEYTRAHHLEDFVIFTGPIPHHGVPPYLDLIDIAVQPAANEYCCPMKIIEYMGLGKPIVGPRQENIEELVREGELGYLFTPGDVKSMAAALSRMVADPDAIRRMGLRCTEVILERKLLWTENAVKVIQLLHPFLRSKERPSCPPI